MNPHDLRKDRTVRLSPGENFECHYPVTITSRVFKGRKWIFTVNEAPDGGATQFRAPEAPAQTSRFPFFKGVAVVLLVASAFVAGRFDLVDKLPDRATVKGKVEDFLAAEQKFHAQANDDIVRAFGSTFEVAREKAAVARDAICTAGDAVYSAARETGWFLAGGRKPMMNVYCGLAWAVILIGAIWGIFGLLRLDIKPFPSGVRKLLKKNGLPLGSLLLALLLVPFEVSARIFTAFYQLVAGVLSFGLRKKNCSHCG